MDYRGYGRSGGSPTISAMMQDSHVILDFVEAWLKEQGFTGPLVVMGRSLGSAPALELAAAHAGRLHGLILESAFAYVTPLLELLGVDVAALGLKETEGFGQVDKIRHFSGPTLIIHGEHDNLIRATNAQALFDASPAVDKARLIIAGAGHNDLLLHGLPVYMEAIRDLAARVAAARG